tara:strand:- start:12156 stop:16577 length:4422 start_codon:yes stop_codon:yes gene_type:complete
MLKGFYDKRFEVDSCGLGLFANIDGKKNNNILLDAISSLNNLSHRSALSSDYKTGDGAGILFQKPHEFFIKETIRLGIELPDNDDYAVGVVFLPQDESIAHICESIIEKTVINEGQHFLGWRDVPVALGFLGPNALKTAPRIRQFFVSKSKDLKFEFEQKLFVIRRQIEISIENFKSNNYEGFYICSLSSKKIIYKGLFQPNQLVNFYHDLSDYSLKSSFAIIHSRFSTNTLGNWDLAHPYRYIAHNGEINTISGNINWMSSRSNIMKSPILKDEFMKVLPVTYPDQSDSFNFDASLEFLISSGMNINEALSIMIPPAWSKDNFMNREVNSYYEYYSTLMEPWDGPAFILASDGDYVSGIMDRNGLRPCRYWITSDNRLIMGSESGLLYVPDDRIVQKGRLGAGEMFCLDTISGELFFDNEVKSDISKKKNYQALLETNLIYLSDILPSDFSREFSENKLNELQVCFSYTSEDLNILIADMANDASETIYSMGDDTPIALLSKKPQPLFNYFRQLFAQVSNPPIDAIREKNMTSINTIISNKKKFFKDFDSENKLLKVLNPILTTSNFTKIVNLDLPGLKSKFIDVTFDNRKEIGSLEDRLEEIFKEISLSVEDGYNILILSDQYIGKQNVPIPSLLLVSAVHQYLIKVNQRSKVSLVLDSGEPRQVHHIATLFGYGVDLIYPYLAIKSGLNLISNINKNSNNDLLIEQNIVDAFTKGLIKVMSKMGIASLDSYRGAQIFEALGLDDRFVKKYFSGTYTRIGGIKLHDLEKSYRDSHYKAYNNSTNINDIFSGEFQWRKNSEIHSWEPESISKLQNSTKTGDFNDFKEFTNYVNGFNQSTGTIRGLLEFKSDRKSISISDVEPASEIVKRFATGAMSLGSVSKEAHETLAIAMNRMGAKSNTGEGGEDSNRFISNKNSAIKQVASARFGVTNNYLVNANDLQIKMAQGSKPGEGGQLPGYKVDNYIGFLRKTNPGVELISPPPHHDIYSIEDLAQLIFDLKNANDKARIHVKLVSEAGVGVIAAGVAKAKSDVVLISGDSGGTGASPISSIKHAGLPWELGLAEAQQVLLMNGLRDRIVVQVDGQLKTGRDVAIACLLGAEEFGFATAPLIVMGCVMLRKCHLNACSVGIATQDETLRKFFRGKPEHVINYFFFIAEELRIIMSKLGFKKVDEMVGRVDLLQPRKDIDRFNNVDLSKLLYKYNSNHQMDLYCSKKNIDPNTLNVLDDYLIKKSDQAIKFQKPVYIKCNVNNQNRSIGTKLSSEISKKYSEDGLPDKTIKLELFGSVGQSCAAFLTKGINMFIEGDANDYFCKGLSGGIVAIKPPAKSIFKSYENVIAGNVVLYGATSGKVFISGIAGDRFAIRNSGAIAVVEGVGNHCSEYMTDGIIVVLGKTGINFGAGMSGGIAYIYDDEGSFEDRYNKEMVEIKNLDVEDDTILKNLVFEHLESTNSIIADNILANWNLNLKKFIKVCPK